MVVWSVFGLGRKMRVEQFGFEFMFGQKEEVGWRHKKEWISYVWREMQAS